LELLILKTKPTAPSSDGLMFKGSEAERESSDDGIMFNQLCLRPL